EGFSGMANRATCGVPEGYAYKRIDYAWSKNILPVSMTRFGMTAPGDGSPSDHYGIIVEYPQPDVTASPDVTPPTASITSPSANAAVAGAMNVTIAASDDRAVSRVDLLLDGTRSGSASTSPYAVSVDTTTIVNGVHVLQARAFDAAGNMFDSIA